MPLMIWIMRAAHARLPVPRHAAGCNGTFVPAILPALRAGRPLAAAIERVAAEFAPLHITNPTNQYTPTTHPVTISDIIVTTTITPTIRFTVSPPHYDQTTPTVIFARRTTEPKFCRCQVAPVQTSCPQRNASPILLCLYTNTLWYNTILVRYFHSNVQAPHTAHRVHRL